LIKEAVVDMEDKILLLDKKCKYRQRTLGKPGNHINKNHASSNSEPELIWVMLENYCSLVGKHIPLSRAPFAIHTNRIHGYMYYLRVNNNMYIHFTSKDKALWETRKLLISSEKS